MQQDNNRMAGPDLITSVVLAVLGVVTMLLSSGIIAEQFQRKAIRTVIVSAGLFPFILGAVFTLFGLIIFAIAARRGGFGQARRILSPGYFREVWHSPRFRRGMTVLLLILAYVLLFGNPHLAGLNFTIASDSGVTAVNVGFIGVTTCYLLATFLYLKAMRPPAAVIVSLAASVAVFYAFNKGFGIPIP